MYLFTFILNCVWVLLLRGLFSSCGSRNYSSGYAAQYQWLLLFGHRLYSAWVSVVVAQWVWLPGCRLNSSLVAPEHVGASWVRDQIPVSCIVRQILYR